MLLALQDIGKAGQIKFVGFDASQTFLDAMRAKQLDGVAVQNPMKMGYLGVKTMVAHLKGQPSRSASIPASRSSRRRTWTPRPRRSS